MTTFKSKTVTKDVETVVYEVHKDKEKIQLNPVYQRDVIWDNEMMSGFINSVVKGIVPNHLIFNLDTETGDKICIDGKQRVMSLVNFMNNKIPVDLGNEDNTDTVYYDSVPKNSNSRIMTPKEKSLFKNSEISIVQYTDLSYVDQVDVFNRIQNRKNMSEGEKMPCKFKFEDVSNSFKKQCDKDSIVEKLNKFCKTESKAHYSLIIKLMYIIHFDKLSISKKKLDNFIGKISSEKKLRMLANKTFHVVEKCFSKELLGHDSVPSKYINLCIVVTYWCNKEYDIKTIDKNRWTKLRLAVNKLYIDAKNKNIDTSKTSDDNLEIIRHKFEEYCVDEIEDDIFESVDYDSDDM